MMMGSRLRVARSIARVIFSPTALPIDAIMKRLSITHTTQAWFRIDALPQTIASLSHAAPRPVLREFIAIIREIQGIVTDQRLIPFVKRPDAAP